MTDADDEFLGLFPLGLVLLPGEVVPLHIFEERYKKLIGERLDGGEFGIVLAGEDNVRECGTAAEVADVVERLDDGRLNILVRGGRRFRIVEVRDPGDEAEYLSAVVDYFRDAEPEGSEALGGAVRELFRRLLELMDIDAPEDPPGDGPLSFRLAAAVDFGVEVKQELLESVSEEHRLELLLNVLTALLPQVEERKRREDAIRGNGKGH